MIDARAAHPPCYATIVISLVATTHRAPCSALSLLSAGSSQHAVHGAEVGQTLRVTVTSIGRHTAWAAWRSMPLTG